MPTFLSVAFLRHGRARRARRLASTKTFGPARDVNQRRRASLGDIDQYHKTVSLRQVSRLAGLALVAINVASLVAQGPPMSTRPPGKPDSTIRPSPTKSQKKEPPPWVQFRADLGYVDASGNSSVGTLSISDAVRLWTSHSNKVSQDFGLTYGTNEGVVETNLWTADLQDAYTITKAIGLYGVFSFDRNPFAGIDYRFEQGVGAELVAVNSGRNRLDFDVGPSYVERRSTANVELRYPAGRGAVVYRYTFAKSAYFEQSVVTLSDLTRIANSLVNSQTILAAPLETRLH